MVGLLRKPPALPCPALPCREVAARGAERCGIGVAWHGVARRGATRSAILPSLPCAGCIAIRRSNFREKTIAGSPGGPPVNTVATR